MLKGQIHTYVYVLSVPIIKMDLIFKEKPEL